MPLTRWQKFLFKLRTRYHIPYARELVLIGLPCAIAVTIAIWAFHSGFASIASPLQVSSTNSNATLRALELEILSGNASSASLSHIAAGASSQAPYKGNLYLIVTIVPAIALTPFIIDITRESRRQQRYEQDFADFLFELSELVRGGIDPSKAFLTLAQGDVGSITSFVKVAASQMTIGFTFEQAFQNVGRQIKSPLANRYIDLVLQASYSGGNVSTLIQQAAIDMGNFLAIDKEKRAGLSQYTVILYMGQVVLIVMAAIMVVQFVPQLTDITKIGGAGISGFLGQSDINQVPIERDMFFLVFLNGLFGGLVIGKISEGKIKAGLKHSVILCIICLVAWDAYVLPASTGATNQQVQIHVVSVDKAGIEGLQLADPLIVNVTSTTGAAIDSAGVTFLVTGGGSASPASTVTDIDGEASTQITLGQQSTTFVLVVSGNTNVLVAINGTSGTNGV